MTKQSVRMFIAHRTIHGMRSICSSTNFKASSDRAEESASNSPYVATSSWTMAEIVGVSGLVIRQ